VAVGRVDDLVADTGPLVTGGGKEFGHANGIQELGPVDN
jgi:hypothetical protein